MSNPASPHPPPNPALPNVSRLAITPHPAAAAGRLPPLPNELLKATIDKTPFVLLGQYHSHHITPDELNDLLEKHLKVKEGTESQSLSEAYADVYVSLAPDGPLNLAANHGKSWSQIFLGPYLQTKVNKDYKVQRENSSTLMLCDVRKIKNIETLCVYAAFEVYQVAVGPKEIANWFV